MSRAVVSETLIRAAPAARFGRIASAMIGLALLGATLALVDRQQLFARVRLDPRFLALGVAIAFPQLALCALRWQFTARRLGVPLAYRAALREYALSTALNVLLPFGVLGDALRIARHDRRLQREAGMGDRSPLSAALHSVVVERSAGQLVLGFWALASLPLWIIGPRSAWALTLLAGATLLGAGLYWSIRRRAPSARPLAAVHRLLRDLGRAFGSPLAAAVQVGLSSAILLSLVAQLSCALAALSFSLPPRAALQIFPFMLLSMALPISFAGFGPREAATAALYHAAHLSQADGVAFALTYGVLLLLCALPGIAWFAVSRP